MDKSYYITTAIDYANAAPHIGHVYEKIVTDFLARWHRLDGYQTYFLSGTDEHGEKIAKSAKAAGVDPQAYVDNLSENNFRALYKNFGISFDDFIRTTEARHKAVVEEVLQRVWDSGDIYFAEYEGLYSVGSERFVTEKELVNGIVPGDSAPPELRKESNYFFRMEKYRPWLLEYLAANPDLIQPVGYRNEILEMLKEPVGDLSISRPVERLPWGIPIPWDKDHVCYVWFDALLNYYSALVDKGKVEPYWRNAHHVIGKDILKPHSIFWPTMLKAAGLPVYKKLIVHGHILALDGRKMGKSLGNAIDPTELLERYGVDTVHYALLRETTLGSDSPFGEPVVESRLNADLANDLGNLVSRVRTLLVKYCDAKIPNVSSPDSELAKEAVGLAARVRTEVANLRIHLALEEAMQYVRKLNKYVNDQKPWELAKSPEGKVALEETLYTVVEGVRIASVLLEAALPNKAKEIRAAFGLGDYTVAQTETWGLSPTGASLPEEFPILFPKLEPRLLEESVQKPEPVPAPVVAAKAEKDEIPTSQITIDDFFKVELCVAEIVSCEKHPKADKLLVLQVSLGEEKRQVVSGIAAWYTPEQLVGRRVVLVKNLAPAKLRGLESAGMILAGEDASGKVIVLEPDAGLPLGAKIR